MSNSTVPENHMSPLPPSGEFNPAVDWVVLALVILFLIGFTVILWHYRDKMKQEV